MSTLRWKLVDTETDEQYVMHLNPNSMSPPPIKKILTFSANARRQGQRATMAGVRAAQPAQPWQWGGVIRTQEHHDALEAWAQRKSVIEVHDHLGRVFEVAMQSFEPTDRRSRLAWRMTYVMQTLMLRRTA